MTGWYSTGNHNGGLCYDSGYHLEPPQKGRGGHRVAWQKHNVVKVFLQPQKAPPFDHNDKHGVKLSQQRRSHYVANYQEFQGNVSLKLFQQSLAGQMTELNLLPAQKVKSKKTIYWNVHIFREALLLQHHGICHSFLTLYTFLSTIKSIFMLHPSIVLLDEFIQPHFCLFVYMQKYSTRGFR